ncbi:MAG: hypothetical protein FWE85_06285 [Clostridiales bacterium]|nr:hypothetical protein [Clostridiales bacterium]
MPNKNKGKKIIKRVLYAVLSNVLYGFLVYCLYIWLVGYSPLYVYLGNLALIIVFLLWDEGFLRSFRSKKLVAQLKKELKNERAKEKYYRYVQFLFDGFVSFKTMLYLFYIFILVFSQIIDFYPALINEGLANFIFANRYSILLLIALDQLIGQFSQDRARIREISAEFEKNWTEIQD